MSNTPNLKLLEHALESFRLATSHRLVKYHLIFSLCLCLSAMTTLSATESTKPENKVDSVVSLEKLLREFDAETEKIKGYTVERHKEQMDLAFESHKKMLASIAERETKCLNNMHATREALKNDKITKEERDLLKDHLNDLINNQYPKFADERREIDQNRLKSNKTYEEIRKEQEARLAGRATQRAGLVNELNQARLTTKSATPSEKEDANKTKPIQSEPPKQNKTPAKLTPEDLKKITEKLAELERSQAEWKDSVKFCQTHVVGARQKLNEINRTPDSHIWTLGDGREMTNQEFKSYLSGQLKDLEETLVKGPAIIQENDRKITLIRKALADHKVP